MSYNFRKRKKRIVFLGDSITRQGKQSGGYINKLQEYLVNENLDLKYELIGSGVDGNKVTDIFNRVDEDVLSSGAEIVVIYIGINDVWHKQTNAGTDADTFKETYIELIEKLKAIGIKMMLCTLSVIGERLDLANEQDADVELYSTLIRELAETYELPLIDLRNAFVKFNQENNVSNFPYGILTNDAVHLNNNGNQLVAQEVWKILYPTIS